MVFAFIVSDMLGTEVFKVIFDKFVALEKFEPFIRRVNKLIIFPLFGDVVTAVLEIPDWLSDMLAALELIKGDLFEPFIMRCDTLIDLFGFEAMTDALIVNNFVKFHLKSSVVLASPNVV